MKFRDLNNLREVERLDFSRSRRHDFSSSRRLAPLIVTTLSEYVPAIVIGNVHNDLVKFVSNLSPFLYETF